ncbi:MAG: MBL fold metallo-hydrolase [Candidatus Competibacteraceae bacterium]|nr:MBL fold metallo-hydrolase [Candidatus Competibacteraceae bacterium]
MNTPVREEHPFEILHHGAVDGVTGSCHQLRVLDGSGILIDCGLFQGAEISPDGAGPERLEVTFPIDHIRALVVTHVHIDHVGRIPYLLAAGFEGPILCSEPSAILLPLVLEDALKVGFTRNAHLIERFLGVLRERIVPLAYGRWYPVAGGRDAVPIAIRLQPAGHILGSAYIQCRAGQGSRRRDVVFSGDLGAPYTPLLPAPRSPYSADTVVLESTYGDRKHEGRRARRQVLRQAIEHALEDRGTVLIPAFSIGRTQELLYELEDIIHRHRNRPAARGMPWEDLEIVVDSPLASRFTAAYRQLQPYWDAEALKRVSRGRHPLAFEQLTTIDSHQDHLRAVEYLAGKARPAVVIAASGMCAGGRVVNYLKAMLEDPRHDVLFVGYQARGTPGRDIQQYGPRGGWVDIDGRRYTIRAKVHTIGGYSAHADQAALLRFVGRMRRPPRQVRLIHGDEPAKAALRDLLMTRYPAVDVVVT